MSWSTSFELHQLPDSNPRDIYREIERNIMPLAEINSGKYQMAPGHQVRAAIHGATQMVLALEVPAYHHVNLVVTGHYKALAPNSMPDSLSISCNVTPDKAP